MLFGMFFKFDLGIHVCSTPLSFSVMRKREGKSETQLKNIVFQLDKGKFPEYTEDEEPFSVNFLWLSL